MATPILSAKLYVPPPRTKVVTRVRLIARLNKGAGGRLTLISAPAGFGKTTLASEWIAAGSRPAAWLSLDEADSDAARFLVYLVAAMRTIAPGFGDELLSALQSPQPPPVETLLTALLNEIGAIPDAFLLVLDDYHVLDAKPVDEAVAFLIDHMPPHMHLVITTREDPPLPLARLRVRDQLTELRAADLRFTAAEAAEFLAEVMELDLSAEQIAALEGRTEGWIAGLQLAALSMRGRDDVDEFVHAFAGDNRYVVDYLVEEVLQRQPERVRSFLLQTAILDRLNGPLCDAVTCQEDGSARLEALRRGNFFVVPLDDTRSWYRYHHLFADVLSTHLTTEHPELVPVLHRRASEWYQRSGAMTDAIRHALVACDFERAADLVELATPATRRNREEVTALGWFKALPVELFRNRPVLSVYCAGTLMQNGEFEGVEARLQDAERWLDADASPEMVVLDTEEFQGLAASVAIYRAALALIAGDFAGTVTYSRRVLDHARDGDDLRRGSATALIGLAYWTAGDLEAAHQSYTDAMELLLRAGYVSDVIGCAVTVADLRIAQARLHEAMRSYERGLQLATSQGVLMLRGAADMHVGLCDLHREHGKMQAAMQHLTIGRELGDVAALRQYPYRWRVALARIREAEGDLDGALALLHDAERVYVADFAPNVRPVAALKVRIWIAQGRLDEAIGWAQERGLSASDDLGYLREFEHMALARICIAKYKADRADHALRDATGLLLRLLDAAEEGGRTRSVIEILILHALASHAGGDLPAALASLERALGLAEPRGFVRTFVDEGQPMAVLLEKVGRHSPAQPYARRLLTAFGRADEQPQAGQPLAEPLSERELEVLRLLRTDLDGPDLARELVVSLNTLRTHTKNIYGKLGVNNRRAAVRRAEELHLL